METNVSNPFDWQYLTSRPGPDELLGPFSVAYLVFVLAGLALSGYVYIRRDVVFGTQSVPQKIARLSGRIGLSLFLIGLLIFGLRVAGDPQFGLRIWMYVFLGITLLMGLYAAFYYFRVYPALLDRSRPKSARRKAGGVDAPRTQAAASDFKWQTQPKRKGKKKR